MKLREWQQAAASFVWERFVLAFLTAGQLS
jgi:hypothetical protein